MLPLSSFTKGPLFRQASALAFRRLIPPLRMAAEIDFTYIFNNTIIPLLLQAKDADFRRFARIFSCLLKFFPQDAATACHL